MKQQIQQELSAAEWNDQSANSGGTADKDTPEELRLQKWR
jgi:hypothetical protein